MAVDISCLEKTLRHVAKSTSRCKYFYGTESSQVVTLPSTNTVFYKNWCVQDDMAVDRYP